MNVLGELSVPRDPIENLEWRSYVLERASSDVELQLGLFEACRRDILFWVNTFVWQYNPNAIGAGSRHVGPFVTWPFQDDAIREMGSWIRERKDGVIEKSREMGASWLCLLLFDHQLLFADRVKFLVISRSEDAVDKTGDPDSLFWKLDFVHQHLPTWMTEGRVFRRKMGFENKRNGNFINGQASTGRAGVGGRATAMFIDEFSQIKEDFEVLQRTSDTTGCRIFNGTHLGTGTAFFELTDPLSAVYGYISRLQMHWTQHPDKWVGAYRWDAQASRVETLDPTYSYPADYKFVKDGTPSGGPFAGVRSPWYDAQCRRKGSTRAVAMDLDIDARGSAGQFFDAMTIRNLKAMACDPVFVGELHYDKDTGTPYSLVPVESGHVRLWIHPRADGSVPPGLYKAGSDISWGTGSTPSTLTIFDAAIGLKVCEVARADMHPPEWAVFCVAMCRLFRTPTGQGAMFAWEVAGPGHTFTPTVIELGYRNFYYRTDETGLARVITDRPGWFPTTSTTLVLLEDYRAALANRSFDNRSAISLDECLLFVYTDRGTIEHGMVESSNDPSGAKLNHSDRVIADALAWKMAKPFSQGGSVSREPVVEYGSFLWRRQLHESQEREEEYR